MLRPSLKGLRSAIWQDGIGYVIGLGAPILFHLGSIGVPWPIPVSLLYYCKKAIGHLFGEGALDWDLADWPARYCRELPHVLDLQYRQVKRRLPCVVVHENPTGQNINHYQVTLALQQTKFQIPKSIEVMTERSFARIAKAIKSNPQHYEETGLRLVSVTEHGNRAIFRVQPVDFMDYVRTNLLMDLRLPSHGTLRTQVHNNGSLEPLDKSVLANLFGINILVFTTDGRLILQKRSRSVGIRRGEYAPSGSGGMAAADAGGLTETTIGPAVIVREVTEEIGLPVDQEIVDSLTYLGTTRELIRGGLPEIFFFTKSNLSEAEVIQRSRAARDRYEFARIRTFALGPFVNKPLRTHGDFHALSSSMDLLLDRIWNEASIPLLTALTLWLRFKSREIDK